MSMETEKLTLTCPDDPTKTYTYGKRGRKPKWVQEWEAANPDKVPTPVSPQKVQVAAKDKHYDLYQWIYLGETTGARRAVVAANNMEALLLLNKVSTIAVSGVELRTLWKRTPVESDDTSALTAGVWDYDLTNDTWKERISHGYSAHHSQPASL